MPVAAEPAPRNMMLRSLNRRPVIRVEEYTPASATAAVPWMSSLKHSTRCRYLFSSAYAFGVRKSSNWISASGYRDCTAVTNSSTRSK